MCFACGVYGDSIDLVRQVLHVGFGEALAWIKAHAPASTTTTASTAGQGTVRSGARLPDEPAIELYGKFYRTTYTIEPGTRAGSYLQRRGIDLNLALELGATTILDPDETWADLTATFSIDRLQTAGLVSRRGNFLLARHRLLFFYFADGRPVYLQARDIDGGANSKELSLKGVCSPALFNVDALRKPQEEVFICEGCIDTLSAVQMGKVAVGVPGVQTFREEWLDCFAQVQRVIIAFDNDRPGQVAAAELCARFRARGIRTEIRRPRSVKDMNDLLKLKLQEKNRE
jgi:DNA primase